MRWQIAFPSQALTWANASNHIGYQIQEVFYHLGFCRMPTTPLPVPPDELFVASTFEGPPRRSALRSKTLAISSVTA